MAVSDSGEFATGPSNPSDYGARATVDLDWKEYPASQFRMRAIRTWHNLRDAADLVDVHVSSGGMGLHFVAWFEDDVPFHEQVAIRRATGDDPRRVAMDCERWLNGLYTDVLFETKEERPQTKERRFADVYDALDYIYAQRDDHDRMRRLANDGRRGAPGLVHRMEGDL